MRPRKPAPLHRRLVWWLLAYLAMISIAVFSVGNYVHEHAEHSAWRALLNSELDSIVNHIEHEPHYRWQDSDTLRLFTIDGSAGVPESLRTLHPGLHDGVLVNDRASAVMIRETDNLGRLALVLDINDFHELEEFATRWVMLAGVVMIIVTVLMASFGVSRLVRPLSSLATRIDQLKPGVPGQRVVVDPRGSSELYVIADAVNDYLARNEQFVERERAFITTTSHELRTPIAVITGAAELWGSSRGERRPGRSGSDPCGPAGCHFYHHGYEQFPVRLPRSATDGLPCWRCRSAPLRCVSICRALRRAFSRRNDDEDPPPRVSPSPL